MRYKLAILFSFFALSGSAQIVKTAGIPYTATTPSHTPSASGSAWAIDTANLDLYAYYGGVWNLAGERIQTISGCAAPAYTPGKGQSVFVINGCDSLYYYRSGAWVIINAGGGGGGGGVSDGDKGDIDVSASGTVWTIDTSAITNIKINNNAIDSTKVGDKTLSLSDLNGSWGVQNGSVLKWNGTNWRPGSDNTGSDGNGIYSGNGDIPTATAATIPLQSYFKFDWWSGNDALLFDDFGDSTSLYDPTGASAVLLTATKIGLRSTGNIELWGGTGGAKLRMLEPTGSGANYTQFQVGAQSADITYTLPATTGSNGQYLQFTTGGQLQWSTVAAGVTDGDKDDITVSGSGANWNIRNDSVTSPKILDGTIALADMGANSVDSTKIGDKTVSLSDLNGAWGANAGSVLKWDGNNWRPGTDNNTDAQTLSIDSTTVGGSERFAVSISSGNTVNFDVPQGTVTSVGIAQPAAGITVTNSPVTTSGNITLALANDLGAVEGLTTNGIAVRTGDNTWTTRSIAGAADASSTALPTITNFNGVNGDMTISISTSTSTAKLTALVATTANITLSGTQTIDGVALSAGNRVLVKNQNTASQNGLYVVSTTAWARATDLDANTELNNGVLVYISRGTANGGKYFRLATSTEPPLTITTSALSFSETLSAGVTDGDKDDITVSNSGANWNIRNDSVTTPKILNGTILFEDIGQNSASPGQVIKWNGTAWAAAADNTGGSGSTDLSWTGASSPYTLNSSSGTDVDFAQGGGITLSTSGATLTIAATDQSITNEGSLTVGAGTATTSVISSNTSGSTNVTLEAGSNITLSESANTITIASTVVGVTDGNKDDIVVSGSGANWNIRNDSVTSPKILDGTIALADMGANSVDSTKVGDKTISLSDINGAWGAQNGSTLKWNGTNWRPASDTDTDAQTLSIDSTAATGIERFAVSISNGNTVRFDVPQGIFLTDGDKTDITVSSSGATWTIDNGAVSGIKIASNAVDSTKVGDKTLSLSDLNGAWGAQNGSVLKWDGNNWRPGTDNNTDAQTLSIDSSIVGNVERFAVAISSGNTVRFDVPQGVFVTDGDKTDITVSSNGATWAIDNDVVTYAKIQNVSTNNRLLGRGTAGAGDVEEITISSGLALSGTTLTAVDQSATNEIQTIANTSDATSHTVTLSNSGGSVQLIQGAGIDLTTGGNSGAGTVTIAATNSGTVTSVGISEPAAGITVSNSPITSSGNITLALANDLGAVEGLTTNGIAVRTGDGTWTTRSVAVSTDAASTAALSIGFSDGVSGNPTVGINTSASSVKLNALVATTGNITLSGTQTIDGINLFANNRVLVKNQNTASENGIWIVSSGAWSRASDLDVSDELNRGVIVYVGRGLTNGGKYFRLTTSSEPQMTINSTSLTFSQIFDGFSLTDGDKTDITVSGSGATWTIDADVVDSTNVGNKTLSVDDINGGWGAQTGSVLKWNGTNWRPGIDETGGGGVSDGDKGDIDVTGSGATWTVDTSAVDNVKLASGSGGIYKGSGTIPNNAVATVAGYFGYEYDATNGEALSIDNTSGQIRLTNSSTNGSILIENDSTTLEATKFKFTGDTIDISGVTTKIGFPGGTGTVTTSGSPTTDRLAKFTGSTEIGNSLISESGQIATVNATGALIVPVGNSTTQLPSPASNGMVRYDTDNNALEYYNAGAAAWEVPLKSSTATGLETGGRVLISDATTGKATSNSALRFDQTLQSLVIAEASTVVASSSQEKLYLQNGSNNIQLFAEVNGDPATRRGAWTTLRSRGTHASKTLVSANDEIGRFQFGAHDGTDYETSSFIGAIVSGTPANNNIPIDIYFTTGVALNNRTERMRVTATGNVGIGVTAPTAALHLKAGTATANSAPLKFTSGTLNTTAEAGAMEYDGTNFYLTNGSGTRNVIATSGGNFTPQVTEYTTAQTNTTLAIPSGATFCEIVCIGGGGGGGSGRRGADNSVRCGGGGGASGGWSTTTIRVSDITGPLLITVGAGGTGGAAQTVDNTNGNDAAVGLDSRVSTSGSANPTICFAIGGANGAGGSSVSGSGGFGSSRADFPSLAGSSANTSGTGGVSSSNSFNKSPGSGASGAGITSANVTSNGGTGGRYNYSVGLGGPAGTSGGNGGDAPAMVQGQIVGGGGGGGGGSQAAAAGGNGGNGVRGGGGGGGAASANGFNSGAGGNGGAGYVRVTFY